MTTDGSACSFPGGEDNSMQKIKTNSIVIEEKELTDQLADVLITLSCDWEAENSCRGYRRNTREDFESCRIFTASDGSDIVGYLFGHPEITGKSTSVMPGGTPVFEADELYIKPAYRNRGIGKQLFRYAEEAVRDEAEYIMVSTASKNWRAILHFYLEELDMEFWSARLFRKVR